MKFILNKKIYIISFCVVFFLQNLALAQEARLTNIIVTNTHSDLLLYLEVEGAFTEKTKNAILSGVPATFSFFITLHQIRSFWADKTIADMEIEHTIKYNSLKKEFVVERSWENSGPVVTKSFAEAKKLMTGIESLKIAPLSELKKGSHYQMQAKAELRKLTLPLYLHYVLFFVSLWDFETDWHTVDFTY